MGQAAEKLTALRAQMQEAGVAGYLVPRADEFLDEYVPPSAERLSWLTGFDGSAGFALVLPEHAVVMSDSRYTIQLKQQVDKAVFETADVGRDGIAGWLKKHDVANITIGFDPSLHSVAEIKRLEKETEALGANFRPVTENLIDRVWSDRPLSPRTSVEPFLEVFAGRSAAQKRELIADQLTTDGFAAAVLPSPADMAWLLNIRGRDVPHTPLALSMGVIYADGSVDWVIDPMRISPEIQRSLGNAVRIVPPENMADMVMKLKAKVGREPVLMDDRSTTYRLAQMLEDRNVRITLGKNPVIIPRACKTAEEQNSMRESHRKDAVAMIRFLHWLDEEAPKGKLDEMMVADKLISLRGMDPAWRDTSFDTIAGMGPNGAIVHYRATEKTNRKIKPDGLLLVDSGAQYAGGTTDITRTILVGEATDEMRTHYTAVLKAHIAMADAVFAKGTNGVQIDAIVRAPLWRQGMDFGHGTGHGVGCYLSVHEDGPRISSRGTEVLLPGMVVSNEPGYYREGEYGIRLENLVLVVPSTRATSTDQLFYEFETLSLVPFDPNLTRLSMLTQAEQEWLATYHTRILEVVGPMLAGPERRWLEAIIKYFC